MRKIFRQGDVLLVQVDQKAEGTKQQEKEVVLAYGEVTGHSHKIVSPGAALYAVNENLRLLQLEENAELRHEEHAPIQLPAGTYQVIQQRENTACGWRTVVD